MTEEERILTEIERCEMILGITDNLGAEQSGLGMTHKFTDKQIDRAERRLPMLRIRLNQIQQDTTDQPYIVPTTVR